MDHAATQSEWSAGVVDIVQAADLQDPVETSKAKISIYLHRALRSATRRDRGPRLSRDGVWYRPSIPLDLHYLITAWSSDARTAHQLLGWTIRVLHDTPVIPSGLLNAHLSGVEIFDPDENVELSWEPLSITDLSDVWQIAAKNHSPSATYIARGVQIDSDVPMEAGAPVTVRQFDYAAAPS